MRGTVYHPTGKAVGEILYYYTYPKAVADRDGKVQCFREENQRCGVLTDDGQSLHFTVTFTLFLEE